MIGFPEYEEFHTRVVFYRIPKNAGTSICTHLSYVNLLNFHKRDLRKKTKHPTYVKPDEFKDFLVGENLKNYFSFCVVRNPWDRVVSLYHSLKLEISFDDFCKEYSQDNFEIIGQQVDWCVGKYPPTEILRFENLNQSFKDMVERRGLISTNPNLPHINMTNHDHYSKYYNSETKDIITNVFKEDIECFGYEFNLADADSLKSKGSQDSLRI